MARKGFLACALLILAQAEMLQAQQPARDPVVAESAPDAAQTEPTTVLLGWHEAATDCVTVVSTCQVSVLYCDDHVSCRDSPTRSWASFEYLLWWVRDGNTPPLASTGAPTDRFPGALGQPGTRILFGGEGALDYGALSGFRGTIGSWRNQDLGFELNGFVFAQRAASFGAASDALGNPPLYLPLFQNNPTAPTATPHEGSFTIADPLFNGGVRGGIHVESASRLWGAEANAYCKGPDGPRARVDWLVGFRYLGFDESLALAGTSFINAADDLLTFRDSFTTHNQFYGGQVGAKVSWGGRRWALDLLGSLSLGGTHQIVSISGTSTNSGAGAVFPGNQVGGVLTLPSNIGRRTADEFSVVPALQVKVGYCLTRRLKTFVGYDFLYWSEVARAGDQIDRRINDSQAFGQPLVGSAVPALGIHRTDFIAHGLNFGVEFRY